MSVHSVLVIDDDEDIRQSLSILLEMEGYPTVAAGDGDEAIAVLRDAQSIGCILLDMRMPGQNGGELAKTLLTSPDLPRVPIVLMSGDRRAATMARAIGASAWLPKPLDVDELLRTVRSFVGEPQGIDEKTLAAEQRT